MALTYTCTNRFVSGPRELDSELYFHFFVFVYENACVNLEEVCYDAKTIYLGIQRGINLSGSSERMCVELRN